mgnify:CR=1 FL=1
MASILKGAPVVAAMNERNAALCEQLKTKGIVPTLAVVAALLKQAVGAGLAARGLDADALDRDFPPMDTQN